MTRPLGFDQWANHVRDANAPCEFERVVTRTWGECSRCKTCDSLVPGDETEHRKLFDPTWRRT